MAYTHTSAPLALKQAQAGQVQDLLSPSLVAFPTSPPSRCHQTPSSRVQYYPCRRRPCYTRPVVVGCTYATCCERRDEALVSAGKTVAMAVTGDR